MRSRHGYLIALTLTWFLVGDWTTSNHIIAWWDISGDNPDGGKSYCATALKWVMEHGIKAECLELE